MNIMNVTEHLFNPLVFWENEEKRREAQRKKSATATATARLPFGHFPPCAKALCPMMPQPIWSWGHSDTFSARCAGRRHIGDILRRQDKVAFIKSQPRAQKHTLSSHAHIHKRCAAARWDQCTIHSADTSGALAVFIYLARMEMCQRADFC